ncbi:MAG: hypothetical protein COU65_02880 [Candidatus Pacebacteria bacterium CG10_big_fil_rev_8_21_14_0_10_42_12]|nr:glycosyltransferase family 2 protein [Candidatus Paceibacterota bacterium]PIR62545.1 MAG: hypothetical protein COU65_02880 [Candidatus Pacebacteria bacterium CG10_big_fil_rev_8_21_14_0_10_42_12]
MNKAGISVIIPTFNGRKLLEENLPSILSQLSPEDEVIIVDDGGSDSTNAFVEEINHLQIKFVRIEKNVRFARAANKGAELAKNDFIFLCNNDVELQANCLSVLRAHTSKNDVFAVGCLEYEDHLEGEKSGKNKLWFARGLFQHSKSDYFVSGETAWASGGSALFSKEKWQELGGFDTNFSPAYWEDVDLSFRARKKGWKVLFDEKAVVIHKHETTNASIFSKKELDEISWKNGQYFTWKNTNFAQKITFLIWWPYWYLKRIKDS